jgi:hypothetical protein
MPHACVARVVVYFSVMTTRKFRSVRVLPRDESPPFSACHPPKSASFFFLNITIIYNYMILYGLWSMYKFSSCFFLNMPPTELRISVSRRRRSGKRRSIAPSILPRGICWSPKGRAMIWWGIQRCQKWPWGRFDEDDISWNISYTSNIIYII